MPAEHRYLTGDGTMGTAGNWIGETGNIVPIAGDTAIVGGLCAADATDVGAAVDVDMLAWEIHETYRYSFGTSAAPIGVAATTINLFSNGPVFMECASTLNVDMLLGALARPDVVCELGSATGATGEWVDMWLLRGHYTLKVNIDLTAARVFVGYISNPSGDCNLTIAAGAPTLPTYVQDGGYCKAENVITTATIGNGTLLKKTAKITTAYVQKAGILNYEYGALAADNTTIHVFAGGLLDLLTNEVPKNIDNVFVHPGGALRYSRVLHTFSGTYGLILDKGAILL